MSKEKQLTSCIWNYYTISPLNNCKAICKLCELTFSRGGQETKSFNTSNLVQHLRSKHVVAYTNFQKESKEKQETAAKQSTATIPRPATIEALLDRRQPFQFNDQRALDWNKTIAEFMALDVQPFSVVDNVGFRRIIAKAEPRYQIPSGKYFSSTLIPQMHTTIKNKIREMVSCQPSVSFTSDAWSDPSIGVALLSLTAHWITDDFHRKQVILAASTLEESHTGDYLGGMLLKILAEYNIQKSANHVLLRDNGANMIKASRVADIDSISCFAHTMQLVINDCIMSQRAVEDILAISRSIVGKFRHSVLAQQRLSDLQESLGVPKKKLVQDVQTRWNATLAMLRSLVEQKQVLGAYATEHELPNLNTNQWTLISHIIDTLTPFEDATKEVSDSQTSISVVLPMLSMLRRLLDRKHTMSEGITTMRKDMLASLNKRFAYTKDNRKIVLATILDPRFKNLAFDDGDLAATAKQWLKEECIILASAKRNEGVMEPPSKKPRIETDQGSSSSTPRLWDLFSDVVSDPAPQTNLSIMGNVNDAVDAMIGLYLSSAVLPRTENPYVWWNGNKLLFPYLATLARRYLSAPASSVPSEQLFSGAGQIFSDRRGSLKANKGEMLLLLKYNLPQFSFNY